MPDAALARAAPGATTAEHPLRQRAHRLAWAIWRCASWKRCRTSYGKIWPSVRLQAILRDIYRPVHREKFIERTVHEIELDPAGQRAYAEAKAGLSASLCRRLSRASR